MEEAAELAQVEEQEEEEEEEVGSVACQGRSTSVGARRRIHHQFADALRKYLQLAVRSSAFQGRGPA